MSRRPRRWCAVRRAARPRRAARGLVFAWTLSALAPAGVGAALNPDAPEPWYPDAWDLWRALYRGDGEGAAMAPLEFGFWFARFRDRAQPDRTVVYVFVDSMRAAGALFDEAGRVATRSVADPGGPLVLQSRSGAYLLGVDVEAADRPFWVYAEVYGPAPGEAGRAAAPSPGGVIEESLRIEVVGP